MNLSPEDLLQGNVHISSLPIIYMRINEAVSNPRSSTSDISAVIGDDPGLTSRLLRLVNSAFYGYPTKIDTISRALFIVGTQQLRDLALATSIISMFKGISRSLVDMESFWRHSIACGIAAKILATYRRTETNVERYFVAGTVHDIGRLIIYQKKPDLARKAFIQCRTDGDLLYAAERKILGFDHADVGRLLLQTWNLPPSLTEVVSFHHNPKGASSYPVETSVIHVADIIAHCMRLGSSGEHYIPPLSESAWDIIGLPTSVLSPVLDQLEREFTDVQRLIFGTTNE
ncbi:MAG: HDOD domain-containing protein [Syntrophales bacterium]